MNKTHTCPKHGIEICHCNSKGYQYLRRFFKIKKWRHTCEAWYYAVVPFLAFIAPKWYE